MSLSDFGFLVQNFAALVDWRYVAMWVIGGVLIFLAVKYEMEPTLLLPLGFGTILVNIPFSGAVDRMFGGELQEGEALPSMRALAKDLRISVITTKRAYEDLERDGFVVTVAGKGCFVAPRNLELMREEQRKRVEQTLEQAVEQAQAASITLEEMQQMLSLLYEEG